jgi:hypothetical protein
MQEPSVAPPPGVTATSRIDGTLMSSAMRGPAAYVQIQLQSLDQPPVIAPRSTKTEVAGRYSFVNLPAGRYQLTFSPDSQGGTAPAREISVGVNDVQTVDVQLGTPPSN